MRSISRAEVWSEKEVRREDVVEEREERELMVECNEEMCERSE